MLSSVYDLIQKPKDPSLDTNNGQMLNSGKLTSSGYDSTISLTPEQLADDSPMTEGGFGASSGKGLVGNYGAMAGQAFGALASALPAKNEFSNNGYSDKSVENDIAREKAIGSVKDTVSSALGPWGMIFRGIEKGGNAIGKSIGGSTGAMVSSAFSPDEAIMANNSDPDVKTGDKILGMILPFHASKTSYKAKKARKDKFMIEQQKNELNMTVAQREEEQRMAEGLEQIEREKNLVMSQMGINSMY